MNGLRGLSGLKRKAWVAAGILLMGLAGGLPAGLPPAGAEVLPAEGAALPAVIRSDVDVAALDAEVDALFKKYQTVGGTALLAVGDTVVYQRSYGWANKNAKRLVNDDTRFLIASITKMVTAVGVMQQVERGALSLDADLGDAFGYAIRNPAYPDDPLTLRQLMNHTSGLIESSRSIYQKSTLRFMISQESRQKTNYTRKRPGTVYDYSNMGAGVMGSLLEKASGASVEQYMLENVFKPLGMDAGYKAKLLADSDNIVCLYRDGKLVRTDRDYRREKPNDTADPERHYRTAIGGVWMNARDMAKLLAALSGDGSVGGVRVLLPETVLLMREEQQGKPFISAETPYGLCLHRNDTIFGGARTVYGHQGLVKGAYSTAYFDPTTRVSLVVFTNGCRLAKENGNAMLNAKLMRLLWERVVVEDAGAGAGTRFVVGE